MSVINGDIIVHLCHNLRKGTSGYVRSVKIQIRLRICAVWSDSSLAAFAKFPLVENEGSDQTVQMRMLIWVLIGHACQKVRFLSCGSFDWYFR